MAVTQALLLYVIVSSLYLRSFSHFNSHSTTTKYIHSRGGISEETGYASKRHFSRNYVQGYNSMSSKLEAPTTLVDKMNSFHPVQNRNLQNGSPRSVKLLPGNVVECKSDLYPVDKIKLFTVACEGETDCAHIHESCFDNSKPGCPKILRAYPCPNSSNSMCITLPQNYSSDLLFLRGQVRCDVLEYSWKSLYFLGFDNKVYLDWTKASKLDLVDVNLPPRMFPDNHYRFMCRATKYYKQGKSQLEWKIKLENGSTVKLGPDRVKDIPETNETKLDYEMYLVRESYIKLEANDAAIICTIPYKGESVDREQPIIFAESQSTTIWISIGSAVVILTLIVTVVWVISRWRKSTNMLRNLTNQEVDDFFEGTESNLSNSLRPQASKLVEHLPYDRNFEIPREKLVIELDNVLGKGEFGTVYKGAIEGQVGIFAVKTTNPECETNRFLSFLRELKIMIYIGKHPNIVSLVGASTENIREKTLFIVMEFCDNGGLESYLKTGKKFFVNEIVGDKIKPRAVANRPKAITTTKCVQWALQISQGMEFLAENRVIHVDLAARNVLIDANANAKISDFGLSRRLYDHTMYVKKSEDDLPWRWMAIESLERLQFSTQSDIWGFGVSLWEIFSLGDLPYPGVEWGPHVIRQLRHGVRLDKPAYCTNGMYVWSGYMLMLNCWNEHPDQRPSFGMITKYFKTFMESIEACQGTQGELEPSADSSVGYMPLELFDDDK